MKKVTIHDAKTNLSKYIAAAKEGEKVFIGSFGKPEVMLVQVTQQDIQAAQKRDFSHLKGKIVEFEDSFSEETDKEISALLTGNA